VSILDESSGGFSSASSFAVTRSTGNYGSGTKIVIIVFGNTIVTTPSGATVRATSVNNLGLYAYEIAGAGQSSITVNCSTGSGRWYAWELPGGASWLTGSASENTTGAVSYTVSVTPTAGDRHILVATGGVGAGLSRAVTSYNNSFTLFGAGQSAAQDWPFAAGADRDVTATGSAISTTGTFNGAAQTAAGGVILAYSDPGSGSTPKSLDDTASAVDTLSVAVTATLAESGSGADAPSGAAQAALADAGSTTEAITKNVSAPVADSASAADALTVTVALTLADAGAAADARSSTAAVTLTDTGAASDAVDNGLGTVKSLADAGAASDSASVAATAALADSASAADVRTSTAAVSLGDTGSAAESVDNGTGTAKPVGDTGSATDSLSVAVMAGLSDVAAAAEALTTAAALALNEAGAAVDSVAAAIGVALTDGGSAAQGLTASALLALADLGTASDAGQGQDNANLQKPLADAGAAADRLTFAYGAVAGAPGLTGDALLSAVTGDEVAASVAGSDTTASVT